MKSDSIPDFKFKHEIRVRPLKCVSALVTFVLVKTFSVLSPESRTVISEAFFYTADLHLVSLRWISVNECLFFHFQSAKSLIIQWDIQKILQVQRTASICTGNVAALIILIMLICLFILLSFQKLGSRTDFQQIAAIRCN